MLCRPCGPLLIAFSLHRFTPVPRLTLSTKILLRYPHDTPHSTHVLSSLAPSGVLTGLCRVCFFVSTLCSLERVTNASPPPPFAGPSSFSCLDLVGWVVVSPTPGRYHSRTATCTRMVGWCSVNGFPPLVDKPSFSHFSQPFVERRSCHRTHSSPLQTRHPRGLARFT